MPTTIVMKAKDYLASLTESGNLPSVKLVRMMQHNEHSYICRVKNVETGEIFPMSIYVKGFLVARDVIDPQQLAELDTEERWQKAWKELDVTTVPQKPIRNPRNPFKGKDIYDIEPITGEGVKAATPTSPDIIQGRKLDWGDYIVFRTGEPTSANPDAKPLPVPEKHIQGYIGKVIRFIDTRIVVQTIDMKALYYVRPSDVTRIAKKKQDPSKNSTQAETSAHQTHGEKQLATEVTSRSD